jgi:hypothetical protein
MSQTLSEKKRAPRTKNRTGHDDRLRRATIDDLRRVITEQRIGGVILFARNVVSPAQVDAAAVHLQSLGVRGCVIDWTSLTDLYEKFGFKIYNQYLNLFKEMQNS